METEVEEELEDAEDELEVVVVEGGLAIEGGVGGMVYGKRLTSGGDVYKTSGMDCVVAGGKPKGKPDGVLVPLSELRVFNGVIIRTPSKFPM